MNSCGREGRPDMYGLGIRLGIYLQWFGEILVEFFDDADVSDIRLLGLLLSGAIVLALLVEIVNHNLRAADIYIMLQLAGGSYIFLIPIYIWKTLTCCDRKWDPLKWTREIHVPVYSVSSMMVLVIISSLQLWFFSTYMPTKGRQCEYYGFFFTKVKLDNVGFIVVNIILHIIVILVCVGIVLSYTGFWERQFRIRKHRRRKKHRTRQSVSLPSQCPCEYRVLYLTETPQTRAGQPRTHRKEGACQTGTERSLAHHAEHIQPGCVRPSHHCH